MNSRLLCLIASPRGKVQHYTIKSETFYWFHNPCFHIPNLRFLVSICVLVASAGSQAECPFFLDCLLVLMASCSIALENSLGASQKPGRSWAREHWQVLWGRPYLRALPVWDHFTLNSRSMVFNHGCDNSDLLCPALLTVPGAVGRVGLLFIHSYMTEKPSGREGVLSDCPPDTLRALTSVLRLHKASKTKKHHFRGSANSFRAKVASGIHFLPGSAFCWILPWGFLIILSYLSWSP